MSNTQQANAPGAPPGAGSATMSNTAKPPLVELKNGRLMLKQKPLSFEKMSETMQEIVKFREMLEQRMENNDPPLDVIPDDHKPLIAKLSQESDKSLNALAKAMQQILIPEQDGDDEDACQKANAVLSVETVEKAIQSVATRVNYGLGPQPNVARVPASWHVWRWEVKDEFRHWLPKAAKEKVETRLSERRQAREDVQALFSRLPEAERCAIFGVKNEADKPKLNTKMDANISVFKVEMNDEKLASRIETVQERSTPETMNDENGSTTKGRPKKPLDPEKAAKEKEKLEKKLARAEKEKREKEAQEKSRSLFANFFGKAKAQATAKASPAKLPNAVAGPSSIQSDYEKTFKPFVLKKDAELAPQNWFRWNQRKKRQRTADGKPVIVIDDDEQVDENDVQMLDAQSSAHLGQLSAEERLRDSINQLSRLGPIPPSRPKSYSGLKTSHPYIVRNIISQLNEAEIAGDDQTVRSLLALLRSRKAIPAKLLIFHTDARPGYFGTWTRPSREVGPRTPFARDVVAIDYTYDSGEEWAEEDEGGDDVVEDADEDDAGGDDADSDLDSWLVDDDDIEDPGTPIEEREGSPFDNLPPPPKPKRKADGDNSKGLKRRKVVVPLVPFSKGPCWDENIRKCEYEPFNPYRIHIFNDFPLPIDPFKDVAPVEDRPVASTSGNHEFAVPALPERLATTNSSQVAETSTTAAAPTPKRPPPAPKTTFPSEHLPVLVSKITSMETGNITAIVEVVFQELRAHKVKKNAIEAKVREIGEKNKKVWIVKPEVKAAVGLAG
ncbi:hypothetical protein K474DRAFT_1657705 [Panus rudis PR-1116 ss-1]|nr:hypothetical protein K474DRAFT_1657705 [Panus rudis PR-1116 ss-1]